MHLFSLNVSLCVSVSVCPHARASVRGQESATKSEGEIPERITPIPTLIYVKNKVLLSSQIINQQQQKQAHPFI